MLLEMACDGGGLEQATQFWRYFWRGEPDGLRKWSGTTVAAVANKRRVIMWAESAPLQETSALNHEYQHWPFGHLGHHWIPSNIGTKTHGYWLKGVKNDAKGSVVRSGCTR